MFEYEFVGREALERLESTPKVVGINEVVKVPAQLVVIVILEALDGLPPSLWRSHVKPSLWYFLPLLGKQCTSKRGIKHLASRPEPIEFE